MLYSQKKKNYLKVVWQLGAPCVAGIHSDCHKTVGIEFELSSFEEEHVQLLLNGSLDAQDLLRHHRQHLQLNAVELIEASPGSRRRQPFKKLSTRGGQGGGLQLW